MARNPIPPPAEYVSPTGRPIWIDHKGLVLKEVPRAIAVPPDRPCADLDAAPRGYWAILDNIEADVWGTGMTEAAAWRDAHFEITEPEECKCPNH